MLLLKNSFFLCLFLSFVLSDAWVAKYKGFFIYETDFYRFLPLLDWKNLASQEKKKQAVDDFLKHQSVALEGLLGGFNNSPETSQKISFRFYQLLVNEYYMKIFLSSVIPPDALMFCQDNLKKEVFVNHVLFSKKDPADSMGLFKKASSVKDSLLLGMSFSRAAALYSEDPSAKENKGALGWLSIGQVVPAFQSTAFSLCLGCVDVVETSFGFHVVRVDSVRPSAYASLSIEEYNDFAFRFSSAYIDVPLKALAAKHDSVLFDAANIVFSDSFLEQITEKIKSAQT